MKLFLKKIHFLVKKYTPETVSLPCFSSSSAGKIIFKEELCEDGGVWQSILTEDNLTALKSYTNLSYSCNMEVTYRSSI